MSEQKSTGMGTAVVTGASSGLGKVYADRLAKRGYDLILVARRADRLEALAADLKAKYGVAVETAVVDLSDAADLERFASQLQANPLVTMLVNNAGTSQMSPLADSDWSHAHTMLDLNITALTRLTVAVLPGFKQRDHGTIVNIGSVVGLYSYPGVSVYCGTKAYVLNFTRTLQMELAGTRVRVQLVAPAATVSEIWDVMGVPLTMLDPSIVMTAEHCVDAAMKGLDLGEPITLPSVDDPELLIAYEEAGSKLLAATQTGRPATRYHLEN